MFADKSNAEARNAGAEAAPYGLETFKLVAASQPFNGKLLEQPAISKDAGQRSGLSPLEKLLSQAATNQRSTDTLNLSPNSWATASIDVEIREK